MCDPFHRLLSKLISVVLVIVFSMANVGCGKSPDPLSGFRPVKPMIHVAESVSIEGSVTLTGGLPDLMGKAIDVGGNPLCSQHGAIIDPTWKISSDGGLADVVVRVKNGSLAKNAPDLGGLIDQRDCLFLPNLLAIQVGQAVRFKNSDMTFHNVRIIRHEIGSELQGESIANYAQASLGGENIRVFDQPGIYRIECDVHRWMRGWVSVNEGIHFAVSDLSGKYQISRALPDGDFVLEAWHPQFSAPVLQNVKISGGKGTAHFEFKLSSAFRS